MNNPTHLPFVSIYSLQFCQLSSKNCFKTCHLRHTTSAAVADMAATHIFTMYLIIEYAVRRPIITSYKMDLIKKRPFGMEGCGERQILCWKLRSFCARCIWAQLSCSLHNRSKPEPHAFFYISREFTWALSVHHTYFLNPFLRLTFLFRLTVGGKEPKILPFLWWCTSKTKTRPKLTWWPNWQITLVVSPGD